MIQSFLSRTVLRLVVVVVASAIVGSAAAALDPTAVDDASIPTLAEAEQELTDAVADESSLTGSLTDAEDRLEQLQRMQTVGARAEQTLRQELADARRLARQIAVGAYVSEGSMTETSYLLGATNSSELTWRSGLALSEAERTEGILRRYRELADQASADLIDQVLEADLIAAEIENLRENLFFAGIRVKSADQMVIIAGAHERAADAIESEAYGAAPDDAWARLRFCESSDDYGAISRSGRYRGAYQFDLPTWESVGGTGDPALATPAEQDARARELYARRGSAPWPICGRYLP